MTAAVKRIYLERQARRRFLQGVDLVADLVARTFGPVRGLAVIDRAERGPLITGSGQELARALEADEPVAELGVRALREAALAVSEQGGGSASATILLSRRLLHLLMDARDRQSSARQLREALFRETVAVVQDLGRQAEPCDTPELWRSVARSAGDGDEEVADWLTRALMAAGFEGRVRLEEGQGAEPELLIGRGHQLARGHTSTAWPGRSPGELIHLTRPVVLISSAPLFDVPDVLTALELARAKGRPLLVFAPAVTDLALETLAVNDHRGRVPSAAVCPALSEDEGTARLQDLATLTGATLLPRRDLLTGLGDLGEVGEAWIDAESTRLVDPRGEPTQVDARISALERALTEGTHGTRSPTGRAKSKEQLEDRLRTLRGPEVTLRVGGRTDTELQVRTARFQAAYTALEGAIAEGVVAGGGAALVHARRVLPKDALIGPALGELLRLIAESAAVPPAEAERKVLTSGDVHLGLDAKASLFCDLHAAGVVDSVRGLRLALQTAAAVGVSFMDAGLMMVRVRRGPSEEDFSPEIAEQTREGPWSRPFQGGVP